MLQVPGSMADSVANFISALVTDQLPQLAQEFKMLSLIAKFQTLGFIAKNRLQEEKGATAVEYGIMVGLIAVVIIAVVVILGPQLAAMFQGVSDKLPAAPTTSAPA